MVVERGTNLGLERFERVLPQPVDADHTLPETKYRCSRSVPVDEGIAIDDRTGRSLASRSLRPMQQPHPLKPPITIRRLMDITVWGRI